VCCAGQQLLTADVPNILSPCHHQQVVTVSEAETANDAMPLQHQQQNGYQHILEACDIVES
jgi:hypothetical protein